MSKTANDQGTSKEKVGIPPEIAGGYVILSRLILEKSLWSLSPDHIKLSMYLLMSARSKPIDVRLPSGDVIRRGEMVTSLAKISDDCSYFENRMNRSWSRKKVSRLLLELQTCGYIKYNSHTKGTHISICNYAVYQRPDAYKSHTEGTVGEHQGNSGGTVGDINNKGNNGENGNNQTTMSFQNEKDVAVNSEKPKSKTKQYKKSVYTDGFELFWSRYPRRNNPSKATAFTAYTRLNMSEDQYEELNRIATRFKNHENALGNIGSGLVPMAATWLNERRWDDAEWAKPAPRER